MLNPFYDVPRQDIIDYDLGGDLPNDAEDIVKRDLEAIQRCVGIVAVVNEHTSIGTIMEISYAYIDYRLPIYVICTDGRHNHPWLQYHATKIFKTYIAFEQWAVNNEM